MARRFVAGRASRRSPSHDVESSGRGPIIAGCILVLLLAGAAAVWLYDSCLVQMAKGKDASIDYATRVIEKASGQNSSWDIARGESIYESVANWTRVIEPYCMGLPARRDVRRVRANAYATMAQHFAQTGDYKKVQECAEQYKKVAQFGDADIDVDECLARTAPAQQAAAAGSQIMQGASPPMIVNYPRVLNQRPEDRYAMLDGDGKPTWVPSQATKYIKLDPGSLEAGSQPFPRCHVLAVHETQDTSQQVLEHFRAQCKQPAWSETKGTVFYTNITDMGSGLQVAGGSTVQWTRFDCRGRAWAARVLVFSSTPTRIEAVQYLQ